MSKPTDKTQAQIDAEFAKKRVEEHATKTVEKMNELINKNKEILSTEQSYYDQIFRFYDIFIRNLTTKVSTSPQLRENKDVQNFLKKAEKLLPLIDLSGRILEELKVSDKEQKDVDNIFIKHAQEIKEHFGNYAEIYNDLLMTFDEIKKLDEIDEIQKAFTRIPEVKQLDVASHLILPIQRGPRYVLLLNELTKLTNFLVSEKHPAIVEVKSASGSIGKALDEVNKLKKLADSANMINNFAQLCKPRIEIEKVGKHFKLDTLQQELSKQAMDNTNPENYLNGLVISITDKKNHLDMKDVMGNILLQVDLKNNKLTISMPTDSKILITEVNLERALSAIGKIVEISHEMLISSGKTCSVTFKYEEQKLHDVLKSGTIADATGIKTVLQNLKNKINTLINNAVSATKHLTKKLKEVTTNWVETDASKRTTQHVDSSKHVLHKHGSKHARKTKSTKPHASGKATYTPKKN